MAPLKVKKQIDMKKLDKYDWQEIIFVAIYIIAATLGRYGISFGKIITIFYFPLLILFLAYLEIKRGNFKIDSVWTVFTLFYKSFYLTAMFFIMSKYPGYQIMAVSALVITILYIILTYFVKKNNNLAIRAVIYYLVFGLFLPPIY
ncbi:MAG: hypothetical protein PWQ43_896 [Rikenellaceae bacterium]|nr:hypothetical protein [Rikenellaceae bacterium]MDI3545888.1 hypothetical protein [Rikenellaceae bacterium]MDN5355954.1 hypothetical protein [Rikenellaceae bacterium]